MSEWDRTEEWEVQRIFHGRSRLTVLIRAEARASDIASIRRIVPELRCLRPSEISSRIDASGKIEIGAMEGREARRLEEQFTEAGIAIKRTDTSSVSFVPVNRTRNSALLIEDPDEANRVAKEMIAEGIPVVDVEA
ncbi:MAG: hypothetical protein ACI8UO_000251 [Verrucomicrobiales bacterium]|jgi:hypothetical protein